MLRVFVLWLWVFVSLLAGCSGEGRAPGRDDASAALFRVDVERPGGSPAELSTGAVLPLMVKLRQAAGADGAIEVVGGTARRGAATVLVRADDAAAVEAALRDVEKMLPQGTAAPRVAAWQAPPDADPLAERLVVEVDALALAQAGLDWSRLEQQVRAATENEAVTAEALRALQIAADGGAAVTLGEVARVERRAAAAGPTAVVQVVAPTHEALRTQLDQLELALAVSLGDDVRLSQAPARVEALEVRMHPEVMFDKKVHFPELQPALARFAHQRTLLTATTPAVELLQRPAPLEQAAATQIQGKWGNAMRLDALAGVSVVQRPEAYLRLPGGAFAGYLLIEGASADAVALPLWQSPVRATFLGERAALPPEHEAFLTLR